MNELIGTALGVMLLVSILSGLVGLLRTPTTKGWFGEAQGAAATDLFLDKTLYTTINNITIQTSNGTTQIDHVVVSKFGIFVIETKNMKGWIFGDERSRQWTQCIHGRKYRFQNPLHQNYRHVRALAEFLNIDPTYLHSLVMFWGEAEFKTPLPPNVLTNGYTSFIRSKQKPLFSDDDVNKMISAIQSGMLPKTAETREAHVESLKIRHASKTTCPKCSSELVVRTARSGANAGGQFYGCSKFPACRYARNLTS